MTRFDKVVKQDTRDLKSNVDDELAEDSCFMGILEQMEIMVVQMCPRNLTHSPVAE